MTIDGKNVASAGVGGTALGLGIGALGVELLNGGLGGLLGGGMRNNNALGDATGAMVGALISQIASGNAKCSENQPVTRYELDLESQLAKKDTEIAILKSENFTNAKILEASNVLIARIQGLEARLNAQDVANQATQDAIVQVKSDLCARIANEAEKRCCADNAIVNYVNATFYPKQVANVTTGDTTVAQSIYNPVPNCGGCCRNGSVA